MIDAADIEQALRTQLPPDARVPALARLLAEAANSAAPHEVLQQQLAADPTLARLLGALAGKRITLGDTVMSFEQSGRSQQADSSRGITLNVTRAGDDRRQGVTISGGVVNGVVVGFNEGTINYTEVTVNIQTGTLLNSAAR